MLYPVYMYFLALMDDLCRCFGTSNISYRENTKSSVLTYKFPGFCKGPFSRNSKMHADCFTFDSFQYEFYCGKNNYSDNFFSQSKLETSCHW